MYSSNTGSNSNQKTFFGTKFNNPALKRQSRAVVQSESRGVPSGGGGSGGGSGGNPIGTTEDKAEDIVFPKVIALMKTYLN